MPIHVFGHKNPDTDAIVSAITLSYWLNQQDIYAVPYRLGNINTETQYLLNLTHMHAPQLLTELPKQSDIALVDHNESQQSIDNLNDYKIRYVIDHHKLGDLTTPKPAHIHLLPVGSTATLLYMMFQQAPLSGTKFVISQQIAMLMLGAIISDTLNLTGPTTTDSDRHAVSELTHTAGVHDQAQFAKRLFEAKSDISGLSAVELVTADYKQFRFANTTWGIASIETASPEQVLARVQALQTAIDTVKQRDKLDFLLVVIVDILQQQSWAIATSDAQNAIITQAFDTTVDSNTIALGNRVSRKLQFVPALERYYQS